MKLSDLRVGMLVTDHEDGVFLIEAVGKDYAVYRGQGKPECSAYFVRAYNGYINCFFRELIPKIKVWVNINRNKTTGRISGHAYKSRQSADYN